MIRDAIHREHAYRVALATEGNLPDPDSAQEDAALARAEAAAQAMIDGVVYTDEEDDWDESVPF